MTMPKRALYLTGSGSAFDRADPVDLDWLPAEVVSSCSTALHRLGTRRLPSLGVSSALRADGRTTVSLGAAAVQRYEYGRSTVLLDLDLENPQLAERLGAAESPGLAEYLRGEAPLASVVQELVDGLALVSAGNARGHAARLLTQLRDSDLIPALAAVSEVVVGDLPPLLPDGLGERVLADFDQTLFVVRAGRTPLPAVRDAVGRFPVPPPVFLNEWSTHVPRWLVRAARC